MKGRFIIERKKNRKRKNKISLKKGEVYIWEAGYREKVIITAKLNWKKYSIKENRNFLWTIDRIIEGS